MRSLVLVAVAVVMGCGGGGGAGAGKPYTTPGMFGATAVWAFAPDDVWVGGDVMSHFDGSTFKKVDTPPTIGFVADFMGFAPDDLYAVSGGNLVHWDGAAWSIVD